MVFSNREKVLLALLGLVCLLMVVYFSVGGLQSYRAELEYQVATRESILREIERMGATLATIGTTPSQPETVQPLISVLESLARGATIEEELQLNLLPQDRDSDVETAEVRVDGMTLDELLGFLHAIENAQPQLVVDHIELSPAFRDKTRLRATLRIMALK